MEKGRPFGDYYWTRIQLKVHHCSIRLRLHGGQPLNL